MPTPNSVHGMGSQMGTPGTMEITCGLHEVITKCSVTGRLGTLLMGNDEIAQPWEV